MGDGETTFKKDQMIWLLSQFHFDQLSDSISFVLSKSVMLFILKMYVQSMQMGINNLSIEQFSLAKIIKDI